MEAVYEKALKCLAASLESVRSARQASSTLHGAVPGGLDYELTPDFLTHSLHLEHRGPWPLPKILSRLKETMAVARFSTRHYYVPPAGQMVSPFGTGSQMGCAI